MAQVLFWMLCAPDGHAKNFSLFIRPGGRFQLTPLYDVISAYPILGHGPNQISPFKVKLAMAVRGKNAHWKMKTSCCGIGWLWGLGTVWSLQMVNRSTSCWTTWWRAHPRSSIKSSASCLKRFQCHWPTASCRGWSRPHRDFAHDHLIPRRLRHKQRRETVGDRPAREWQDLLCGVVSPGHKVARPAGIEPATPAFGGQYSIH